MLGRFSRVHDLQVPEAFQKLLENADSTLRFAIEVEEKIPMEQVRRPALFPTTAAPVLSATKCHHNLVTGR